jgi:hypothetical protein
VCAKQHTRPFRADVRLEFSGAITASGGENCRVDEVFEIAEAAADSASMSPYRAEWQVLRVRRHNVLLEGRAVDTNRVLGLLQPHLRGPIRWCQPQLPLTLPSGEAGVMILKDVVALSDSDQARLLQWLDGNASQTQIVSTTDRPLFARVARGLFDATLYYRLNTMLLQVGPGNRVGSQDDDNERAYSGADSPATVSTP